MNIDDIPVHNLPDGDFGENKFVFVTIRTDDKTHYFVRINPEMMQTKSIGVVFKKELEQNNIPIDELSYTGATIERFHNRMIISKTSFEIPMSLEEKEEVKKILKPFFPNCEIITKAF